MANRIKNSIKVLWSFRNVTNYNISRFYSTENLVKVEYNKDVLKLHVGSSAGITETLNFNAFWLRFNCHTPNSKTIDSNQRIIDADKVPVNLTIKNCTKDNENICIEWNQDSPKTVIPIKYLMNYCPIKKKNNLNFEKKESGIESFNYSNFFVNNKKNESELHKWTKYILTHGVCLLKNVPIKNGIVLDVGKLLGPVQNTLYGDIFDVMAIPKPTNLAYSDSFLCLHQDLVYYESPPGLQLLHCIKNDSSVQGGESIILDAFLAAQQFRDKYPQHFKILTQIPATFQKILVNKPKPLYMVHKKPHIVLNHRNKIIGVNWAPQNEGPIVGVTDNEMNKYYKAYIEFTKFLNKHPNKIEFLLKPGDILIFNNRRMLHSRNSFKLNGGIRHLQGCYVNMDLFKSEVLLNEYIKTNSEEGLIYMQDTVLGNYDYNDGL